MHQVSCFSPNLKYFYTNSSHYDNPSPRYKPILLELYYTFCLIMITWIYPKVSKVLLYTYIYIYIYTLYISEMFSVVLTTSSDCYKIISLKLVWMVGKLERLVMFYGVKHWHSLYATIQNRTRKWWSLVCVSLNVINKTLNLWFISLIFQSCLSLVLCFLWNFVSLALLKFVSFDRIWRNRNILKEPPPQIRICSSTFDAVVVLCVVCKLWPIS